ncbi:hypothetical protein C8J57DRAFT_1566318 [Mycena rebaudengoi]|nr:hypothetical protein C8J57DRAFT_1566318 [Mycena rebaudengoi]
MGRKRKRGGETEKVQQEYEAATQGHQKHWGGTPRPAKTQTNGRWRQSTPQEDAKNSQEDMNKKGDVPAIDKRQALKRIAARDEMRATGKGRKAGEGKEGNDIYARELRRGGGEMGIEKEDEKERSIHHIISYEHDPSGSYFPSPSPPPEPAPDPSHTPPRDESETAPCSAGSLAPRPRPAQTRARAHRACGPQCTPCTRGESSAPSAAGATRKAPGPELRARVDGELDPDVGRSDSSAARSSGAPPAFRERQAWNRAAWNKRLGAAPVLGIAQECLVYKSFDVFRKDGLRRSCGRAMLKD